MPEYEASSLGRVRRIPHLVPTSRGLGLVKRGGKAHFGQLTDGRYILVYRRKTRKVHRLVCEAFHGPAPFAAAVVMHLDENPLNNRADNLAWGTQKENLNAPGYLEYRRKTPRTRLDPPTVSAIKAKVEAGASHASVARHHGIAATTVTNIMAGRSWRNVPGG